jgi:hypothetical protein
VKGIEPSFLAQWSIVASSAVIPWHVRCDGVGLLALLALAMAYLYRRPRSPFWYVVYFDADQKEVHRSTALRADDPNDTAKAKALRAELEAKEHHRQPVVNSEGWDTWVPQYLERQR